MGSTPPTVSASAGAKNRLDSLFHAGQNMLFVPLVGTTSGAQGADTVILHYVLVHLAAEAHFASSRWNLFTLVGKHSQAFKSGSHLGCFNNR